MLSQVTAQQYGSCAQISEAHVSHPFFSFAPVLQTACLQVPLPPPPLLLPLEELPPLPDELPPPPQLSPQMEPTSPTQIESHSVLQQYESCEQMSVTHVLQDEVSLLPVEQSE